MLPTINKRFLLQLVLVLGTLTGILFGAHSLQARRIPEALKQQSDRAAELAQSDPKQVNVAIHYLRQYLEFCPEDVDALERLVALIQERPGPTDPSDLLRLYDKILRLDPARHDTRRQALKASVRVGRFTDAETHAKVLIQSFPNDYELRLNLAYALRGLQKHTEARECYETAIRVAPQQQATYQEYAEFLSIELKKKDEAKAVLDRLIQALPNDPESYTARARFHTVIGDERAAIADARHALELAPQKADAMLLLGEQLQKKRETLPAAAELYREGMKNHPSDARFVRNLSWLEVNRGNYGMAVSVLEDGMAKVNEKDGFDLLVPLADMLLQMNDLDRAKQLMGRLARRRETDPAKRRSAELQAIYLQGRLAMSEMKWDEAIRHLSDLRAQTGDMIGVECQANLLLSLCHQRKGEFDREEQTLKMLLDRDPNHGAGRVALGLAYQNAGRFEDAIAEYELAARLRFATADTRANLLKMKAAKLRHSRANKREWADLDTQLGQFAPSFGQATSDYALLRADLLIARGEIGPAIAVLQAETAKRPTDPRLWAKYALTVSELAGVSGGLAVLDEAQAVCGDRAELRLARATLYANDPARLRPLDPLVDHIDTWPEADQNTVLFGLIELYDRLGDEAGVVRTYRRIAGRHPANVAVWEGLFDRATRNGNTKIADDARAMLTKLQPPTADTSLLRAWEVANARRVGEAAAAAEAIVKQFGALPERADACVVLARLKVLTGEANAAEPLFARAVRLEPVRFGPTQEYLTFLTATGNSEKLTRLIERLSRDHRWNGEPLRRAIRQTIARVDSQQAKPLLDSIRFLVERVPNGLGWLGDCYQAAGLRNDAASCYERAIDVPTASADDWLRLAIRTAEAGDTTGATRVLARAKTKLPSAKHYLMTAAVFADSPSAPPGWAPDTATPDEKKLYVQARLAVKLSRFQKDEAISLLDDYLNKNTLSQPDAAWARRNLAMMLVARGAVSDRTRAKELLTAANASPGGSADEKRATAAILAGLSQQLGGDDRKQVMNRAIEVLSSVATETKNPKDRFLLSQLYRTAASLETDSNAQEHRAQARRMLQELIKADPKNTEYYVAALDEATEPEDQEFAKQCAGYLIANHKNDFRVVQAVARYECRAEHPDRALAHILAYTRLADDTPGDLQSRSGRAAELLDELTRRPEIRNTEIGRRMTDAAIEQYESLFVVRPEVMVAIAGLLTHDGRSEQAFAKIEKHSKLLPPRVKVLAGLSALRAGNTTEAQLRTVQSWLDTAKSEEPGSIAVLLHEGELLTLQRETAAAERVYQVVLDLDDQNVVALNNLAWLLATRADTAPRSLGLVQQAIRVVGQTGSLLDTRARAKITLKQYDEAEQDLSDALKGERTPLRLFHLALLQSKRTPDQSQEARATFHEAKKRGLSETLVHPYDVSAYQEFDQSWGGAKGTSGE
jgi:tetratricopeptide (TPR) repeat protein